MYAAETISELRRVATAVAAAPAALATPAQCRDALRAIQAAQDSLDAAKAAHLAALDATAGYEEDGASTLATWARLELRLDAKTAHALVAAGSTLAQLPEVADAAASGAIRLEHVAAFTYGLRHIGAGIVTESEPWLLDVARTCEPAELRKVIRSLREAIYPDALDKAWAEGMDRQDIQVNAVPNGYHVNGFLGITTGAKFRAVLDSCGAPRDAEDQRSGSERRVDALDELLTKVLESGLPSDKGVRPHLSVMVDAETLQSAMSKELGTLTGPAAPARLAGFGSIGPELLGYLGCLSDVTPILTEHGGTTPGRPPQARVLNVGRSYRLATLRQRRAVIARQEGECAAPGCHSTHLEIHHEVWWSLGGKTDLDHMVGLCPRCHHLVHRELLLVKADGLGGFTFTNRDSRPLRRAYDERAARCREIGQIRRTAARLQHRRPDVLRT